MASTRKRLEALTAGLVLPAQSGEAPVKEEGAYPAAATDPAEAPGVETRFPPALARAQVPRTGPGQMMAFRGQVLQVEQEMAALRDKLSQYDGVLPTRKLDPTTIRPSRWANRHEKAFSTSAFQGLKSDIEQAGGNVQPILVRPIAEEAGRYEIVFGHRRHRASLELGMPVLASIWTDDLGDAALFAAMDRENRERADLSNYEQGLMYQRALEEQLFPTQRQLATALGVSHTWVRKALMVAQLPSAIVECFKSPLEISFRHAEVISRAMDQDRRGVLKRAEKLRGQGLSSAVVVARLVDAGGDARQKQKIDVLVGSTKVGVLERSKTGEIVITIKDPAKAPDLESLQGAVLSAIRLISAQ